MTRTIPAEGSRTVVPVLSGYTLVQNRPMACRTWSPRADGRYSSGCKCGTCDGSTTRYPGTVEKVIHYADNSIEMEVACDDGQTRRVMLVAPHGDVC